jgi:1,4-alpha-glucan branching enzyme
VKAKSAARQPLTAGSNVITIVLNAHVPFTRQHGPRFYFDELPLFATISETILPMLEMFERLEADGVPFRLGLAVSPLLCHLLADEQSAARYLDYADRQIAFGAEELKRAKGDKAMFALVRYYRKMFAARRKRFAEREPVTRQLLRWQRSGHIELLAAPATNCFLPFYTEHPEVIRAQIETAILMYRKLFGGMPAGFWLPELGCHPKIADAVRRYGFAYTVIDTHTAFLSAPPPERGSFYPVRTARGLALLIKDHYAHRDIMDRNEGLPADSRFRDYFRDASDDLPLQRVRSFLGEDGSRLPTGYKYYAIGERGIPKRAYDPKQAEKAAADQAAAFLSRRVAALEEAADLMGRAASGGAVSVCAWNADFLGRFWHEGFMFLERVFRLGAADCRLTFMTPKQYLASQSAVKPALKVQTISPEYSSAGVNGYAEAWLDASNDRFYRHIFRAAERMAELAERLTGESGIKERALNQAAREMLLALSSDWPRLIAAGSSSALPKWRAYAAERLEAYLKNFTTIYEALGSKYISTRFLIDIERRDNIFPWLSSKVFRRPPNARTNSGALIRAGTAVDTSIKAASVRNTGASKARPSARKTGSRKAGVPGKSAAPKAGASAASGTAADTSVPDTVPHNSVGTASGVSV